MIDKYSYDLEMLILSSNICLDSVNNLIILN